MADDGSHQPRENSFLSGLSEIDKAAQHGEYGRTVTVQVLEASCSPVRVRLGGPGCVWHTVDVPMSAVLTINRESGSVREPLRSTELAFSPLSTVGQCGDDEEADDGACVSLDVLRETEGDMPTTLSTGGDDGDEGEEKVFTVSFRWAVGPHLTAVTPPPSVSGDAVAGDDAGLADDGDEKEDDNVEGGEEGEFHYHMPPMPPPTLARDAALPPFDPEMQQVVAPEDADSAGEDGEAGAAAWRSPPPTTTTTTAADDGRVPLSREDSYEARATSSHSSRRTRPLSRRRSIHLVVDVVPAETGGRFTDVTAQDQSDNTYEPREDHDEKSHTDKEEDIPAPKPYTPIPPQALTTSAPTASAGTVPSPPPEAAAAPPPAGGAAARQLDFAAAAAAPPRPPSSAAPATVKSAAPVPTANNLFDGAAPDATVAVIEVLSIRSSADAAPGRLVKAVFSFQCDDSTGAAAAAPGKAPVYSTHLLSRAKAACVAQVSVPFLLPEELAADASLPILCEVVEVFEGTGQGAAMTTLLWSAAEEVKLVSGAASFDEPVLVSFTGGHDTVATRWRYCSVGTFRERVLNMRAAIAFPHTTATTADDSGAINNSSVGNASAIPAPSTTQLQVLLERKKGGPAPLSAALWLSQPTGGSPSPLSSCAAVSRPLGEAPETGEGALQCAVVDAGAVVQPIVYFDVEHTYCLLSLVELGGHDGKAPFPSSSPIPYAIQFADVDEWHTASNADAEEEDCIVHYRFVHVATRMDQLPGTVPSPGPHDGERWRRSKDMCELRIRVESIRFCGAREAGGASASPVAYANTPLRMGTGRGLSPSASPEGNHTGEEAAFYRLAAYDVSTGALLGLSRALSSGDSLVGGGEDAVLTMQSFFFFASLAGEKKKGTMPPPQQMHFALLAFPSEMDAALFPLPAPASLLAPERAAANIVVQSASLVSTSVPATTTLSFVDTEVTRQALTERAVAAPVLAEAHLHVEAVRCGAERADAAVFQIRSVRLMDVPTTGSAANGAPLPPLPPLATRLWFSPSLFTKEDVEAAYTREQEEEVAHSSSAGRDTATDTRDWAVNRRWPFASGGSGRHCGRVASVDCIVAAPTSSDRAAAERQRRTLFTTARDLRLCVAVVPLTPPTAHGGGEHQDTTGNLSLWGDTSIALSPLRGEEASPVGEGTTTSRGTVVVPALDFLYNRLRHIRRKVWKRHEGEGDWTAAVLAADGAVAMQMDNYAEIDLSPSVFSGCDDKRSRRLFESTVVGQVRMNHRAVLEIRGAWLKVLTMEKPMQLSVGYQPSSRLWAVRGSFVRRGTVVEAVEGTRTEEERDRRDLSLLAGGAGASTLVQTSTCDVTIATYPIDYTDATPELVADALPGVSPDLFLHRRHHAQQQQQQQHQQPGPQQRPPHRRTPHRPLMDSGRDIRGNHQQQQQRSALVSAAAAAAFVPSPPPRATATSPFEERITTADPFLSSSEHDALATLTSDEAAAAAQQSSTDPSFLMSVLQHKELRSGSGKSSRVFFVFGDAYTTRTSATVLSAEYTHQQQPPHTDAEVVVAPMTVMDASQNDGVALGRGRLPLDNSKFLGISHRKLAPVLEWFHGGLGVPLDVEEDRRVEGVRLWRASLKESDLGAQGRPQVSLSVSAITQQPPSPAVLVSSHTLTRCGENGYFLFGGRDEMHTASARAAFYWEAEQVWTPFKVVPPLLSEAPLPTGRHGHSAVYRPVDDSVYVYGGNHQGSSSGEHLALRSDVWSVRLGDGVAQEVAYDATQLAGTEPGLTRWRHTAVYHDDYMIVVGGQCTGEQASKTGKSRSAKHAAAALTVAPCDPLLYLDLRTGIWEARGCFAREAVPCPRHGHATAVVGDAVLYLYGGRDGAGALLRDLHQLDLMTRMWKTIAPNGAVAPPPLELASMAAADVVGTPCLFLVGGREDGGERGKNALSVYMFSTATHFWRRVSLACGPAEQRYAARVVPVALSADEDSGARQYRQRKGLPMPQGTVTTQLLLVGGVVAGDETGAPPSDSPYDDEDGTASEFRRTAGACVLLLSNVPPHARSSPTAAAPSRRRREDLADFRVRSASRKRKGSAPPRPPHSQRTSARAPRSAGSAVRQPHPPSASRSRSRGQHQYRRRHSAELEDDYYQHTTATNQRRRRPMSTSEVARCVQRLSSAPPSSARAGVMSAGQHHHRSRNGAGRRSSSASLRHRPGHHLPEAKSAFSTLTRGEVQAQIDRLYYQDLERRRANLRDLSRQVFRERYGDNAELPPPTRMATPGSVLYEEGYQYQRSRRQSVSTDDATPKHTRTALAANTSDDDDEDDVHGAHGAASPLTPLQPAVPLSLRSSTATSTTSSSSPSLPSSAEEESKEDSPSPHDSDEAEDKSPVSSPPDRSERSSSSSSSSSSSNSSRSRVSSPSPSRAVEDPAPEPVGAFVPSSSPAQSAKSTSPSSVGKDHDRTSSASSLAAETEGAKTPEEEPPEAPSRPSSHSASSLATPGHGDGHPAEPSEEEVDDGYGDGDFESEGSDDSRAPQEEAVDRGEEAKHAADPAESNGSREGSLPFSMPVPKSPSEKGKEEEEEGGDAESASERSPPEEAPPREPTPPSSTPPPSSKASSIAVPEEAEKDGDEEEGDEQPEPDTPSAEIPLPLPSPPPAPQSDSDSSSVTSSSAHPGSDHRASVEAASEQGEDRSEASGLGEQETAAQSQPTVSQNELGAPPREKGTRDLDLQTPAELVQDDADSESEAMEGADDASAIADGDALPATSTVAITAAAAPSAASSEADNSSESGGDEPTPAPELAPAPPPSSSSEATSSLSRVPSGHDSKASEEREEEELGPSAKDEADLGAAKEEEEEFEHASSAPSAHALEVDASGGARQLEATDADEQKSNSWQELDPPPAADGGEQEEGSRHEEHGEAEETDDETPDPINDSGEMEGAPDDWRELGDVEDKGTVAEQEPDVTPPVASTAASSDDAIRKEEEDDDKRGEAESLDLPGGEAQPVQARETGSNASSWATTATSDNEGQEEAEAAPQGEDEERAPQEEIPLPSTGSDRSEAIIATATDADDEQPAPEAAVARSDVEEDSSIAEEESSRAGSEEEEAAQPRLAPAAEDAETDSEAARAEEPSAVEDEVDGRAATSEAEEEEPPASTSPSSSPSSSTSGEMAPTDGEGQLGEVLQETAPPPHGPWEDGEEGKAEEAEAASSSLSDAPDPATNDAANDQEATMESGSNDVTVDPATGLPPPIPPPAESSWAELGEAEAESEPEAESEEAEETAGGNPQPVEEARSAHEEVSEKEDEPQQHQDESGVTGRSLLASSEGAEVVVVAGEGEEKADSEAPSSEKAEDSPASRHLQVRQWRELGDGSEESSQDTPRPAPARATAPDSASLLSASTDNEGEAEDDGHSASEPPEAEEPEVPEAPPVPQESDPWHELGEEGESAADAEDKETASQLDNSAAERDTKDASGEARADAPDADVLQFDKEEDAEEDAADASWHALDDDAVDDDVNGAEELSSSAATPADDEGEAEAEALGDEGEDAQKQLATDDATPEAVPVEENSWRELGEDGDGDEQPPSYEAVVASATPAPPAAAAPPVDVEPRQHSPSSASGTDEDESGAPVRIRLGEPRADTATPTVPPLPLADMPEAFTSSASSELSSSSDAYGQGHEGHVEEAEADEEAHPADVVAFDADGSEVEMEEEEEEGVAPPSPPEPSLPHPDLAAQDAHDPWHELGESGEEEEEAAAPEPEESGEPGERAESPSASSLADTDADAEAAHQDEEPAEDLWRELGDAGGTVEEREAVGDEAAPAPVEEEEAHGERDSPLSLSSGDAPGGNREEDDSWAELGDDGNAAAGEGESEGGDVAEAAAAHIREEEEDAPGRALQAEESAADDDAWRELGDAAGEGGEKEAETPEEPSAVPADGNPWAELGDDAEDVDEDKGEAGKEEEDYHEEGHMRKSGDSSASSDEEGKRNDSDHDGGGASEPRPDAPVFPSQPPQASEPDTWAELGDGEDDTPRERRREEGEEEEEMNAGAAAAARDLLDRKQGVDEAIGDDDFDF